MKRLILAGAVLALALTGCGTSEMSEDSALDDRVVVLDDGTQVHCIFWYVYGGGPAMSCDWESAARG